MPRDRPYRAFVFFSFSWVAMGLAVPGTLTAQSGEVTGVVRDADTGGPIAGASVTLELADDSSRVRSAVTTASGRLLIVGVGPDRYRVRVESLAYGSLSTDAFELQPGSTHDLGTLILSIAAMELDPLSVTAERAAVTFEADRTSYDITRMPSAQGAMASELLRNMPELEVDLDGQVTMQGARTEIHIDGRPAPMRGMSLTAFLEQFPSDHIERIEVIDNPSARYGAQGSGGIVNIVLREGVELGMTGVAFLNGGTRGQIGVGARTTLQRGPWTLNSGLNLERSNREVSSFDLRQNLIAEPTTFLEQESFSSRTGRSGNADLELRHQPTDRARFWISGRIGGRDDASDGLRTTTQMDEVRDPTSVYRRSNAIDAGNLSGRFGTGFDYVWERRRHQLEVELVLDRNRDREDTWEELDALDLSAATGLLPAAQTRDVERRKDGRIRLSADYTRPWTSDGRLEVGYRLQWESADSDRLSSIMKAGPQPIETELGFEHDQRFNSLYMTLQRQVGWLGVQVGLRGEHADTRLEIPTGESFEHDYYSLFPSASVSARIDQNRQVRLGYSRRIGRPQTSVLNPIDRSTDPLNRRVGNPYIEPEYTHSVNLHVNWSTSLGRLRLSPYYRRTDGGWAQITRVDENGVSTRTWDNVTSEERYGATATAWLRRGQAINGYVSFGGNRTVRDASNLSDRYNSSSLRWQTRANLEAAITEQLSAEARFSYSPAVDLPQGRSDARVSTDFGLRYRFLDRKGSLRMSFQDPLGLQGSSFETRDLTHVQIGRSSESARSIRFNLSYAFGGGSQDRGGRSR